MINNKKIVVINPDNSVSITHISPKAKKSLESIIAEVVPEGAVWHLVDEVPERDAFRNSWVWDGAKVSHNIERAKEIKKIKLRELRVEALAVLDVEYQRADEEGDASKKKQVAAKKKLLRDVTQHAKLLNAKTVEELKALKIEDLI